VPRGGNRKGAGRPIRTTYRQAVTFRLPVHLLTQLTLRAELQGTTVTALVEEGINIVVKRRPRKIT
jgi:predicted HicB family RNase H-like nuclease